MQIAFIVGHFPRLSETFILNQVTGLIDRGHQVDIFSEYDGDWDQVHPDVERYALRQHTYRLHPVPQNYIWRSLIGLWLLLTRFPKAPGLLLRSFNPFEHGMYAVGLWTLYGAVSLIDRGCLQYDIVHCQFGTQGHRGWFLQRLMPSTTKLIVMFRGHDISSYIQDKKQDFYADLFEAADACLTNCDFFRQRLIKLGCPPEKASVHYSGLDVSKFTCQPRQPEAGNTVNLVTTGRLVEKKGIEYAIRAVALQKQNFPNIRYYIIGDGHLKDSFTNLIQELNAETYIHLLGWKNEAEIIEVLNTCHLFIAPSVTASDGNQDAPVNVLKEAMAMGLPVISTYHGGIPELVEDEISGLLVPERDAEALATKLGYLLEHTKDWSNMGKAGRSFVENNFDLQRLNDKLVSRYEKLLERNRGELADDHVYVSQALLK